MNANEMNAKWDAMIEADRARLFGAMETAIRKLVLAMEQGWKDEGWSIAENSGQAPADQLEARNYARKLLGEPVPQEDGE